MQDDTAPVRNTELLERVMRHIDDHPEQHDQQVWINGCGTAACFAGWAALLSGREHVTETNSKSVYHWFISPAGWRDTPRMAATIALGLTDDEADDLFHACNSRDVLRLMVKDLVNGDQLADRDEYVHEAGEHPAGDGGPW